jgi:Uncharacterized protein conserved in bacteria (DUF2188)
MRRPQPTASATLRAITSSADQRVRLMGQATYKVVRGYGGWSMTHDGSTAGIYATKEAAFEAAVLAASNALKQGRGITISVEGSGGQ